MNYVKKMCILRQIKHGFSGDGKTLSGLIKAEQYGKNLAVEVSIINFAPLVSGAYYCLLSDGKGKTEMLTLRGKSIFNILSDLDISTGFCGIICYVKNEVVPIAFGINGNGSYDWKAILNTALPPVFPRGNKEISTPRSTEENAICVTESKNEQGRYEMNAILSEQTPPNFETEQMQKTQPKPISQITTQSAPPNEITSEKIYNDDLVATENYYEEKKDECEQLEKTCVNAHLKGATEKQNEKTRSCPTADGDAEDVLHSFTTNSNGYYQSVKAELDDLFKNYPTDTTLDGAFSCSEWVRVKGEKGAPEYLVGVIYNDGFPKYICYALKAKNANEPPEEIKNSCVFVPLSIYDDQEGFFMIFQSAATGECVKPDRL